MKGNMQRKKENTNRNWSIKEGRKRKGLKEKAINEWRKKGRKEKRKEGKKRKIMQVNDKRNVKSWYKQNREERVSDRFKIKFKKKKTKN